MKCIIKVDGFGTRNGRAAFVCDITDKALAQYQATPGSSFYPTAKVTFLSTPRAFEGLDPKALVHLLSLTDNVVCTAAEIGWSLSGPRNRMAPHICRAGKEGLR
ncbi:MAG: hypothetical protein SPL79_02205 [Sphaerochaetaceae bacterium]|nr:hypothetical protein [Sphaerochaetaceae bacterium]